MLEYLEKVPNNELIPYSATKDKHNIGEEIAKRESIINAGLEQDIVLKKTTLKILFLFLGIETIIVFFFAFLQGTKLWGFALEEWSFKLLITATLLQITYMLQVAVKHLFPTKK